MSAEILLLLIDLGKIQHVLTRAYVYVQNEGCLPPGTYEALKDRVERLKEAERVGLSHRVQEEGETRSLHAPITAARATVEASIALPASGLSAGVGT